MCFCCFSSEARTEIGDATNIQLSHIYLTKRTFYFILFEKKNFFI